MVMKARNVPKDVVIATPNASADKQTSKQPRIAKNGRCERSGAEDRLDCGGGEREGGREQRGRRGMDEMDWDGSIERRAKSRERA
jgi:hypothetical protein